MKPFALLFAALLFATQLFGAPATDQQKLAAADCTFSFRLLKELAKEQPAQNIFISPYSAAAGLQMVCNGAGGPTKTEMADVLGTAGLDQSAINAARLEMQKSLDAATRKNIILNTANALWCRKNFPIKPAFVTGNDQFFQAIVGNLDFDDPKSVDIINAWVAEKTHGKISSILQAPINPLVDLILANALYFKGKWEEPFDVNATTNRVFHLPGGQQKEVPMMEQSRHFEYCRGSDYQAVRLPYEDSSLGMYVFLPDENSSLEKLLSIIDGDTWQRITKPGFTENEGTLQLPKFRIEYGVQLNQPLTTLGMRQAFVSGAADLSGISNRRLFVSEVLQKAFVEVNEQGTEAAAATGALIARSQEQNPPFRMIVDRPFLFLIEDQATGEILFMGIIFDPGVARVGTMS